jgi:hypothetical protein
MFFGTDRLTKQQLRAAICSFAKQLGVNNVIFNSTARRVCGTYNASTQNIFLSLNQTKKQMLNTFFHELGHHESVKKGKWVKYHFDLYKKANPETLFYIENKIELIGKKLWKQYVDGTKWGNYKYFYLKKNKAQMKTFLKEK